MESFFYGQNSTNNIVVGLTVNREKQTFYLWRIKAKNGNKNIIDNGINRIKFKDLLRHLKSEISCRKLELLFKETNLKMPMLYKGNIQDHSIIELVYIIYKKIGIKQKNEEVFKNFILQILSYNIKNTLDLVKAIGISVIKFIDNIVYDKEDVELIHLFKLMEIEAYNSLSLISIKKLGPDLLETHDALVQPPPSQVDLPEGTLGFGRISDDEVNRLRESRFKGAVKVDVHDPGYHFHYCRRESGNTYMITRALLCYNSDENEHLVKLPNLYWERHGDYIEFQLPIENYNFRRALYHVCNSERRKIFRRVRREDVKQLKFRSKSEEAKVLYNPFAEESKKNKKHYSVVMFN